MSMSVEEAQKIVAPLYEALNRPSEKDVSALLAQACNADYRSYPSNQDSLSRDELADVFKGIGLIIPDLRWTIEEVVTVDDKICVRGEAAGTPVRDLYGAKPTGKSFRIMSIDLFTVKNSKLATAFHLENWMSAVQQISS
jgi:predicted ester cyclase